MARPRAPRRRPARRGAEADLQATSASPVPHVPVLLGDAIAALAPAADRLYIDATFGAGGYTGAILEAGGARVIAFDRDITAIRAGAGLAGRHATRLRLVNAPFGRLEEVARAAAIELGVPVADGPFADGVVLDIGVSSMQLDTSERGFSFNTDGPLDMRMSAPLDPLTGEAVETGPSVADFLATADERTIADVLYLYGEEKRARAIARAITADRAGRPFRTTRDLADLVGRIVGRGQHEGRHPATRTFQALRIHINDELGELARALAAAERVLKPGGRLVVVTFHSLEDRLAKRFLAEAANRSVAAGSRHLPPGAAPPPASFQILNPKPVLPTPQEIASNPRARSAKLRAGVRTAAPSRTWDFERLGLPARPGL